MAAPPLLPRPAVTSRRLCVVVSHASARGQRRAANDRRLFVSIRADGLPGAMHPGLGPLANCPGCKLVIAAVVYYAPALPLVPSLGLLPERTRRKLWCMGLEEAKNHVSVLP